MCTVVNLKSAAFTVYIGRPGYGRTGPFGNPFIVGTHGQRGQCVELFESWFYSNDPKALVMRDQVKKHIKPTDTLGCFCKPNACHGDVIAAFVNNGYSRPTH